MPAMISNTATVVHVQYMTTQRAGSGVDIIPDTNLRAFQAIQVDDF
jgi:hypothetical protein